VLGTILSSFTYIVVGGCMVACRKHKAVKT